ncbi:phage baseplate assembly protein V [Iningainema tapete]|uniref:Baseplate assembly protein n=1 Tax=Iningainema tapete BLCC-T55 TaxID=2748662 RepID=A0A8J7CEB2_9CYAN|nr:phage baseplate assembly protein V [Iningainema tapete]MBD2773370.1 baseplate assembly protein [Iningainema tapete BLCC-T55]
MNGQGSPFYGKYRGVVTDNRDPKGLGRVRAKVQDVLGTEDSGWAMPSVPYAGNGVGLFLVPPKDAWVWIEFEHGNPDYPIWTGCFWGTPLEVPATPPFPEIKVLKTDTATIKLSDLPGPVGGITIETKTGMKIVYKTTGIEISGGLGTIEISGSKVSINNGALEVT